MGRPGGKGAGRRIFLTLTNLNADQEHKTQIIRRSHSRSPNVVAPSTVPSAHILFSSERCGASQSVALRC